MDITVLIIIIFFVIGIFLFRNSDVIKTKNKKVQSYRIDGKLLKCKHCEHTMFYPGKSQLNSIMATFWGLEWLNKEASFLSCEACGYMHWFRRNPDEINRWAE